MGVEQRLGEAVAVGDRTVVEVRAREGGRVVGGEVGPGVEPAGEPGVELSPRETALANAEALQGRHELSARFEHRGPGRDGVAARAARLAHPAVHHHDGALARARPPGLGEAVGEEPARLRNAAVVDGEHVRIGVGERRAPGALRHVLGELLRGGGEVRLAPGVGLHHPGRRVALLEAVLERVVQRVAELGQPRARAPLGAARLDLPRGARAPPVLEQDGAVVERLGPGQVVDERPGGAIHRGRRRGWHALARPRRPRARVRRRPFGLGRLARPEDTGERGLEAHGATSMLASDPASPGLTPGGASTGLAPSSTSGFAPGRASLRRRAASVSPGRAYSTRS